MQEGHGSGSQPPDESGDWSSLPSEGAEPGAGGDAPPGTSGAPSPGTAPAPPAPARYDQSGYGQPGSSQPSQPMYGQPGSSQHAQPGYGQPGSSQTTQPGYGQPGSSQTTQPLPGLGQPGQGGPAYGQPGGHALPPGPSAGWPKRAGGEAQPGPPTTELGTWTMSAGGQGAWEPPGGWGPPPGSGYGQPAGGHGQPGGRPRHRRSRSPLVYVLVAVVAAALGAGTVFALQAKSGPTNSSSSPPGLGPQDIPSPGSGQGNGNSSGNTNTSSIDAQAVAAKVAPAVVDITASLRFTGQIFEGTGIVLTSSGLVLTNNHVVDGSTALTATITSSGRRYPAQIVGTDATEDIALLRLVGVTGLKTVAVGDSSKVKLGTPVVALGNAGGAGGAPTVTSGSITALNRTITASDAGANTSETLHNMLQTNAPIAEGDSGGPLSNAAGQVIGIDTAANTQSFGGPGTNQGFAIPINRALTIARQMAAGHGSATIRLGQPAFMGIAVASTSPSAAGSADSPQQQLQQLQRTADRFGGGTDSSGRCLPSGAGNPVPASIAPARTGTLIAGAFCNEPAAAVGLAGGDVILAINGRAVGPPASLTGVLARYHPADHVSVTWMDTDGQRHTSSLVLSAGPAK